MNLCEEENYEAGDIVEYANGRRDYLIKVDEDGGIGVNACNPSWIERGLRDFGDECYAFFAGLQDGAKIVGHFGNGSVEDAKQWYATNKERYSA